MEYKIIDFPVHGDHEGKLVALEKNADFPFEIKRVYYIWDTVHDAIRGASCTQEPATSNNMR